MRLTFTAAAFAAAVLSSACVPRDEKPNIVINPAESSDRVRVGDTTRIKPGIFFKIFADAAERASNRSLEEELLWLTERSDLDVTDARRAAAKEIAEIQSQRSLDELAWSVAAALEASLSQIVQIGFVRAFDGGNTQFADGLTDMSSSFHAAPDRIATKPLGHAIILQRVEMHGAAEMFERFPPPIDLAGSYALATTDGCSVAAGRYELVQRQRIFELIDDSQIAMYGAIGAAHAYFVPNDQRFAKISRLAGDPVEIRFPDRNADIMAAKLDRSDLALIMHNRPFGECVMVLKTIDVES